MNTRIHYVKPVLRRLMLAALPTILSPCAIFVGSSAMAQTGVMVQPTPPALAVERLNQHLNRLSRAPTDMEALIGAGMASYELGDAQAANGFFTRANMVNPRVGRVKLGLALVSLALKVPADAAAYFDDAAQLGEPASGYLAERALAYDLAGEQDKAQRDYVSALRASPGNPALTRGYAISLGISGRLEEAEATIRPLLYQSDRAAWRDRTMILAMNGRTADARRVAQTVMPRTLADAMDPYLQRMGSLTAAQKAAAAHYGQFPSDGLRLAVATPPSVAAARTEATRRRTRSKAPDSAPPPAPAGDDSRLIAAMPRGDAPPLMIQPVPATATLPRAPAPVPSRPVVAARSSPSSSDANDDPDGWTAAERRIAAAARTSTPAPASLPKPAATPVRQTSAVPVVAAARPTPVAGPPVSASSTPTLASATSIPIGLVPVAPAPTPAVPNAPVQGPVAPAGMTPVPVPAPFAARAPASVASPATVAPPRTLAAIMAEIEVPEAERVSAVQPVDLNEIARMQAERRRVTAADKARREAAAKAKAEADAKAKAEAEEKARIKANPSRNWVQIATGRDPAALAFDMRRLRKTYATLADLDAWTAEWGATRRLLVGPFPTAAKAKTVLTDLKKAGSDGFVWQSEAGEIVAALSRK
jgi:Flp pilus assembly protein TadD